MPGNGQDFDQAPWGSRGPPGPPGPTPQYDRDPSRRSGPIQNVLRPHGLTPQNNENRPSPRVNHQASTQSTP